MFTPLVRISFLVVLVLAAVPVGAQFLRPHEPFDSTKAQSLPLDPGEILVTGEDGSVTRYPFQFELADTAASRSTGLMHRAEIAADHGMLFDFKRDRMVTMWMRNTFIPLDMLFLSVEGEIITIAENTVPHSEKTVSSRKRVRSVLEVAAGTVQSLSINAGDRVKHAMFEN
ncbi:MAG: DUF192 domain-containing protein [Alphaproteobacteria bacterium]|nr:DUF192 domain-containing protein [Alphaproteobacteria bacterium]